MSKEIKKVKFEQKMELINGTLKKNVYINEELLDWGIDIASYMEAMKMGPKYHHAIKADIQRHFVDSVSEVVGRYVTVKEITEAIKTGWI